MTAMQATFFIGYDAREDEAAKVCAASIKEKASAPVRVLFMEHRALRKCGLFNRPWRIDAKGQFWDERDKKPFSTEFSHSRFLCFHIAHIMGYHHTCVFLDCDFLFLQDPMALVEEHKTTGARISCVKRESPTLTNGVKMDGMQQHNYNRKLWSALFTFNGGEYFSEWNPYRVNHDSGAELHSFLGAEDIGALDPSWHFIPGIDPKDEFSFAEALHYSEFSPWLNPHHETSWSYWPWLEARRKFIPPSGYVDGVARC